MSEIRDFFYQNGIFYPSATDKIGRALAALSPKHLFKEAGLSKVLYQNGFRPEYPDGYKFAMCLTHDIDMLFSKKRSLAKSLIKNAMSGNLKESLNTGKRFFNPKNAVNYNIGDIVNIHEKFNAVSSYYFLSLQPNERDFNYRLESIKDIFDLIQSTGSEIGLHGGFDAYNNVKKLMEEKKYLETVSGKKVEGYRSHYLNFKWGHTWNALQKADFSYDTTFGYPDNVGFRNGMCYPFNTFDIDTHQWLPLLEIPLIFSDFTLDNYLRIEPEISKQLFDNLLNQTKNLNGTITILWHNNYFNRKDYLDLYLYMLNQAKNAGGWLTSSKNLLDWWKKMKYDEICRSMLEDIFKKN